MSYRFFWAILIFAFAIFLIQSLTLQLIKGVEFRQRSENNRLKITLFPAERGVIYDRNGQVLVQNSPEGREYVLGEAAAHVLGYLGEADKREVKAFSIFLGSQVGKSGIERKMDGFLRGTDGQIVEEVDSSGELLRKIAEKTPEKGVNIKLTIDKNLQERVYEFIRERKGAVVATDPEGRILALASSPSFEPEVFGLQAASNKLQEEKIERIFSDPERPMFNRAIAGLYPPGSTFKIVTAVGALEVGVINESTEVEDIGELKVGEYAYGNWYFKQYGKKEGMVGIVKAIKRSNDIFFYKAGEWLGISKLAAWAKEFGLGRKTGIGLIGEAAGLVPNEDWKKQIKKDSWYLGDTYITVIGQGDLQTTPLQVNQMAAVIANGGKLCKPRLVEGILQGQSLQATRTVLVGEKDQCRELPISEKSLGLVREGMRQACETGGTGWPLFDFEVKSSKLKVDNRNFFEALESTRSSERLVGIPVACKTGTAETYEGEEPHAWFTVFAPVYDPEIVVTVLFENAGEGSYEAAPVAKEILEYWFENKIDS